MATVAAARPPMTARPSGAVCSPPSPNPKAMGTMPASMAQLVIRIGRRRLVPAVMAAEYESAPLIRACSAKVNKQDRVGDRDADGHDGAHEGLDIERGLRRPERQDDARQDRRHRRNSNPRQPRRLKIGRQQQENDEHGHHQAKPQSLKHLPEGDGLPADIDGDAAGRFAGPLDCRCDALGGVPQVFPVDIGRHAHDSPHVVAVVFARHGAFDHVGHVAHQEGRTGPLLHGDHGDGVGRFDVARRDFDLHLVPDAVLGIAPVIRNDEAARRRGRYQAPARRPPS